MQQDPKQVEWAVWLRHRPRDIQRADQVIGWFGDCWFCQLCEARLIGTPAKHHQQHMLELEEWLEAQPATTGPKPTLVGRSNRRNYARAQAKVQAAAFGRDPYLYAVERVQKVSRNNPDDKRVRASFNRRLRHPKHETIARVIRLLEQGMTPMAIADQLNLSDNYTRRLIRLIETKGASNAAL